jgi:hypothetical protein
MLDLIDDVFWMLPLNSDRQAKRVWTDNNITDDVWSARRAVIRSEHRLPTARAQLEQFWKERLIAKGCTSSSAPAAIAAAVVEDGKIQYDETQD